MSEQLLLPALLVPVSHDPIRVRPSSSQALLRQLSDQTGLTQPEIIRRCLRVVSAQADDEGCEFLMPIRPIKPGRWRGGRKPRAAKISELERTIAQSLRMAEKARLELEQLRTASSEKERAA